MGKQITVGRLKEILSDIDDNYIVQLSINEESDLLTHIFIDNESGVVDLTNFEDRDENDSIGKDMFGNELYVGDKVITIARNENKLKKGTIDKHSCGISIINEYSYIGEPYKNRQYENVIRYEW